ncbi:MAG: TrkH family potassium uptake protein [Runella sp.]
MITRKLYYRIKNTKDRLVRSLHDLLEEVSFYWGGLVFLVIVYDLGFRHTISYLFFAVCYLLYLWVFTLTLALRSLRFPSKKKQQNWARWGLVLVLLLFTFYKFIQLRNQPILGSTSYYLGLGLSGILILTDVSRKILNIYSRRFNPALLFVVSFGVLILLGTGLLMLPLATVKNISFVDALFTSVSAVCVTGLATVDVATEFTRLGKVILLVLIQLGGLGIVSFTSFFGYLYQGGFSLDNQLFLKDIATSERLGDVFRSLVRIIVITFSIEALGAILIYVTISPELFEHSRQQWRFAIFHSISAFCNAGFSITPNGLFNEDIRYDYGFQWVIMFLVILGGIGFSIVTDFYYYLKHYVRQLYFRLNYGSPIVFMSRSVSINTRLVLLLTGFLLVFGFATFFLTEYNNLLKQHTTFWGKLTTAAFSAVTPRTAGFNTYDMGLMQPATILIFLVMMWIGASPGSTGGGIKTTTFAVGLLNILSLAKGSDRLEVFGRRVPNESVRRAFSIMMLSLLLIGPAILMITIFEPDKPLISIAFECFSAFSTVGLSLNLTPTFGTASKIILMLLMFVGRVGTFTLFVAFVRRVRYTNYQYPNENIFIN